MPSIEQFLAIQPTPANHWRAIILFGRNSATYKFALASALLELAPQATEVVKLEELAGPFARHICRHLEAAPKQGTNANSEFLALCKRRIRAEISEQQLAEGTVKLGFNNVIDAFHNLGEDTPRLRFFVDERKENGGIRATDELLTLLDSKADGLGHEVEARWRLVETAWSLGLAVPLIEYEPVSGRLITEASLARTDVTSSRDALNGYQKGRCFYCSSQICVDPKAPDLAHVDHFIPFVLTPLINANLNGVWNLVLACSDCNLRKSDLVPETDLVLRLLRRNEYLISSHHPLRETLISQLGSSSRSREESLGRWWARAFEVRGAKWRPRDSGEGFL